MELLTHGRLNWEEFPRAGIFSGQLDEPPLETLNLILALLVAGGFCQPWVCELWPRLNLVEDDGFVAITKDPVLEVPADGAGQDDPLKIPAALNEVFFLIAMRDADNVLLDDRPFVQHIGHIVAGRADQLYTSFEGGAVGSRPLKCR